MARGPNTGTMVQLLDGREVDTGSWEWREECHAREVEARSILRMADADTRRAHLALIEARSGPLARQRMQEAVLGLWRLRTAVHWA